MMFDFETVIKNLGLGNLTAQPKRVTDGYLHKMFRLETTTGKYAVKLLNPVIAIDNVRDIVCITDGDMDCKNVLWKNGQPFIIDLECLDYGNPFLKMFQLALSWAGDAVCDIDSGRLGNFLRAYQSEYGEVDVDWKTLSGAGFSWLDWLEYNTKRALLIECGDEEEQKLGIQEAEATIRRIVYYHTVREDISNSLT